jgi:hypothetical protein
MSREPIEVGVFAQLVVEETNSPDFEGIVRGIEWGRIGW